MTRTGRVWLRWFFVASLACSGGMRSLARRPAASPSPAAGSSPASGSLSGRLTDLHSDSVGGAIVILRNTVTGAEVRTATSRNGSYRFSLLAPGDYSLLALSPRLGQGEVDNIQIAAGHESRVQAALAFVLPPRPPPFAIPLPARAAAHLAIQPLTPDTPLIARLEPRPRLQTLSAHDPLPPPSAARREVLSARPEQPATPTVPIEIVRPPEIASISAPGAAEPVLAAVIPHVPALLPNAAGLLLARAAVASALAVAQSVRQQNQAAQEPERAELAVASAATTLSAAQIQALPATGRRWQEMFLATPGASGASSS